MKLALSLDPPELYAANGYTGSKGIHVFVTPLPASIKMLSELASTLGNPDLSRFYVTVMYSRVAPRKVRTDPRTLFTAVVDRVGPFVGDDGRSYLAAQLTSPNLMDLHTKWEKLGAVHLFEEFMPRITLGSGVVTSELSSAVSMVNTLLRKKPHVCFLSGETAVDLTNEYSNNN